jgi:hypothetical protein
VYCHTKFICALSSYAVEQTGVRPEMADRPVGGQHCLNSCLSANFRVIMSSAARQYFVYLIPFSDLRDAAMRTSEMACDTPGERR